MSTIKVVNIQHPDSVEPNLVLQTDGDTVFASGLTVSGTFDIANDLTVSGNTGLGTSSPTSKLHVVDTTTNLQLESTADSSSGKIDFVGKDASSNSYRTLTIDTSSTGEINIETDPDNGGYSTDKSIIFKQAGSEKARIDNSGNVGIRTSSPEGYLEISGVAETGVPTLYLNRNANVSTTSDIALTGNSVIRSESSIRSAVNTSGFFTWSIGGSDAKAGLTDADEIMRIHPDGNVGIGTNSPDAKFEVTNSSTSLVEVSRFRTEGNTNNPMLRILVDESTPKASIRSSGTAASALTLGSGNNDHLSIDTSGNVTISNDLTIDTDTLYVDSTNNRVGIGTTSPSEALDIQGGLIINGGNITSLVSGTVGDDTFYSLDLTAAGFTLGGVAIITVFSTYANFPQPVGTGIFYYDCGNSVSGARILADADATNPINGGTTSTSTTITDFTDNRITIICNTDTLRIANRVGGNRVFKLTFL